MAYKITACLICRDNEKTIGQCIQSLAPGVSFLSITDTGSKDATVRIIRRICRQLNLPYKLTQFEWVDHFAQARQFNLDQMPESEWFFWCDADDIVENSKAILDLVDKTDKRFGAIWLPYFYASDEYGNATTVFVRERILRMSVGWKWQGRVHEVVVPQSPTEHIKTNDVVIRHNHGGSESRSDRNFKLLKMVLEEEPDNKRTLLYMGHQHFAQSDYYEAAQWYLKFATTPNVMPIERYQALTYCAKALREIKDFKQAINCDLMAIEEYPQWADAYIGMAWSYINLNMPGKALFWATSAKDKQMPEEVIFINPLDYTYHLSIIMSEANLKSGNIKEALKHLEEALRIRPVKELNEQKDLIIEAAVREEAVRGITALANTLIKHSEQFKLQNVLKAFRYSHIILSLVLDSGLVCLHS